MCIVLLTTSHPDYALILVDNRDEYVLRPTSRPQWWTHPESGKQILSSRDLQRPEKGTWLGITKDGDFAVLTNYREAQSHAGNPPIAGVKSRGAMPAAWLGGLANDSVVDGVRQLTKDDGVKGVGGFSMICGQLRRLNEGIAVVSNRASNMEDVPLLGPDGGDIWGLSNTHFDNDQVWPKVKEGTRLLQEAVTEAASTKSNENDLVKALFAVLDVDTMPAKPPGMDFQEYNFQLRNSIFIPAIGGDEHYQAMEAARSRGRASSESSHDRETLNGEPEKPLRRDEIPTAFETGLYGTQRQTVLLVGRDGNISFTERALWDANGHEIPRGKGDITVRFKIDGWESQTN